MSGGAGKKNNTSPSIHPSLAASQYARVSLTGPEAPMGSAGHLKEGM